MGRIVIILTLLLWGCTSSLETDNEFQGKYHIQRIEAYNALTNDLITTISEQDLYLLRFSKGQYVELRMELNGQVIWRLEGDQEDIKQTLEWQRMTLPPNFTKTSVLPKASCPRTRFHLRTNTHSHRARHTCSCDTRTNTLSKFL
jgi:hypothetical protein